MKFHAIPFRVGILVSSLLLASSIAGRARGEGFQLSHHREGELEVQSNGQIIGRYMYAHDPSTPDTRHATYKPFLHIVDPDSGTPVTKGPGGQFTHHRGIFLGWNRLTSKRGRFDFWHMNRCNQIHQDFSKQWINGDEAGFTSHIHWIDSEGTPVIKEWRTMTFSDTDLSSHLATMDISTKLIPSEDVELNGDPEHSGVQYRPANDVQREHTQYLFPQEGQDPRKDLDLPWVGEQYQIESGTYSVIHMNHPTNPKQTKYSAYRDYGRFGAFFTKDLKQGEALEIHYRIVVIKGTLPSRKIIQQLFEKWTHPGSI